jgi:integrase
VFVVLNTEFSGNLRVECRCCSDTKILDSFAFQGCTVDVLIPASACDHSARSNQLDALACILPIERCDRLANVLSNEDVATLRHLVERGMGENTLRALTSDLNYLECWARAATNSPLPWPSPETLAMKFIAHHLWDPTQHEADPNHGMPSAVAEQLRSHGLLKATGPHAPATVKRRLATWGTLHRWRGMDSPMSSPQVRTALRLVVRASLRPRTQKSQRALTRDLLEKMIETCWLGRLRDMRDSALLLAAFASGGRRRSEIARLRVEQLIDLDPLRNLDDPDSPALRCIEWRLGRTKTGTAEDSNRVLLVGRAADALTSWLKRAKIEKGPVFRRIDRWGKLQKLALSPQSVNLILKRRAALAGLDPKQFSAHGLRSGYLTETARLGIPMIEAMQQSQHRSIQQASEYYNGVELSRGRAARMMI